MYDGWLYTTETLLKLNGLNGVVIDRCRSLSFVIIAQRGQIPVRYGLVAIIFDNLRIIASALTLMIIMTILYEYVCTYSIHSSTRTLLSCGGTVIICTVIIYVFPLHIHTMRT